ncbi:MAG: Ig-like domain-containing protein, partial [Anaerolineae bacterium]|nr:Ig-like domain-containing protein [Anaerolineae bacterium]
MTIKRIRWVGGLGAAFVLALGVALLLGSPLVAWGAPNVQEEAPAPRVFDTVPLPGEELTLDGLVTFYFDLPMDQASVEGTFSVDPYVEGDLSWTGDSALTFTPSEEYERATEYTFTIGTGATSTEGMAMEEDFSLLLKTIGYLEVSEVLPADESTAVDSDSVITVIFNRPVVPLVTVEDMGDLPHPLSFDPAIAGEGEWLNTSIYLFTPSEELRGGTTYTATITAGLEDVTGGVLAEDYSWSFSTLEPDVLDIWPSHESYRVRLETDISVVFSQAMDPQPTQEAFSLVRMIQSDTGEVLTASEPVSGVFEWSEDFREMTFTPYDLLELQSTYVVVIDDALALSATGASLREMASSTFYTVPYPAIIDTSPDDGDQDASPYGGFTIYFAGPMDMETMEDKVIIEPEPWREFDTYFYDYSSSYTLSFDTEPSTEYTITILPGMADPYGNTIDEGLVVNYTTAPYPPELTLQTPGREGLYSAYNPTTRVFLTHRNVSRVDLSLWSVSLAQFADLTGPDRYDEWYEYSPRDRDLLRKWSVDLSSQMDKRRYELLMISEKGASGIANIECLGAPDPQVKIGDVAIVTQEDDRPLNVRMDPALDGNVITQVLPGDTFQIIGGPFCEGGYLWWQVRLDNETVGWAAEGSWEVYFYEPLGKTPDDSNAPESDLAPSAAYKPDPLPPGIYYLEAQSPETKTYGSDPRRHLMLVATDNITLKFSQDTALAWVNNLETGVPVEGVRVIFYNENFNPVAQAVTDADGLAVADIPHLADLYTTYYATVDDDDHFGYAVSGWSGGLDPWQFEVRSDYEPENFTVYLNTDRPIYRPDQPVYFKGILRDRDDVTYTVPDMDSVPVTIYDDRGEVIYEKDLPVNERGSFSGQLDLAPDAPLGYYRIVAGIGSNTRDSFGLSFSVAEYRAPEFQVDLIAAVDEVVQGDTIQVAVEARYFFGGPVSNAFVGYTVLSQNYYFNYDGPGYYSFTDENYDYWAPDYYGPSREVVAEGEAQTDAMGNFLIELDADLGEAVQSQRYTIEARVIDESDQLVAGSTQVVVHQGEVYVGLRPKYYIGYANQENVVNLIAVDWDSEGVAGQEIEYEAVERRWFSVQEEDEMGRTVWTWDVEEIPVEGGSGTVTTDADGLAEITFTPPNGGAFKVYGRTTDAKGNEIVASAFLWVSGRDFINWRQENSNRIQLITDKDDYTVGDTAQIMIPSPWQGTAWALITVERGDILTQEVVRMDSNSQVYELDIAPEFAPNMFVSVVLFKGEDENNPTAQFRMGMTQLNVDTSRLVMDLEVTSSVDVEAGEFAGPGDTVDYTIKTTDWEGTPVPNAEIGVSVTDLAVLTIADPNSSELLPFFYSERGVTVRTAVPLTISVDQAT